MTNKIILLFFALIFIACTENYPFKASAKPNPNPPGPKPSKPTIEEKYPEKRVWMYVHTNADEAAKLNQCQEPDFDVDGPCEERLQYCRVNNHIYRCTPTAVRVLGKIINHETSEPVVGARVVGYMPYIGEITKPTWSDEDGDFVVEAGICPSLISILADQYYSLNDYVYDTRSSTCIVDNYQGAKVVLIRLKKLSRTLSNEGSIINNNRCSFLGLVKDPLGQPIAGAQIFCEGWDSRLVTNENGIYEVQVSGDCPKTCNARKDGYKPLIQGVTSAVATVRGQPADMILIKE